MDLHGWQQCASCSICGIHWDFLRIRLIYTLLDDVYNTDGVYFMGLRLRRSVSVEFCAYCEDVNFEPHPQAIVCTTKVSAAKKGTIVHERSPTSGDDVYLLKFLLSARKRFTKIAVWYNFNFFATFSTYSNKCKTFLALSKFSLWSLHERDALFKAQGWMMPTSSSMQSWAYAATKRMHLTSPNLFAFSQFVTIQSRWA